MQLFYRVAADVVVVVHFTYVACVVLGLVLILAGRARGWQWIRNFWVRLLHLVMIGVVVVQAWLGLVCPLTTLENTLRRRAGEATYRGGFIARWVHELLFFDAEPWVFTLCYTLFGLAVVATLFAAPPRRPGAAR